MDGGSLVSGLRGALFSRQWKKALHDRYVMAGNTTTMHAVRAALQRSRASLLALRLWFQGNLDMVVKCRKRLTVEK